MKAIVNLPAIRPAVLPAPARAHRQISVNQATPAPAIYSAPRRTCYTVDARKVNIREARRAHHDNTRMEEAVCGRIINRYA